MRNFYPACLLASLALTSWLLMGAAISQTAPPPFEITNYRGLHAAAWKGDVAQIHRLGKAGADANALDTKGRTPLHVAAFASREQAVAALVQIGADPNQLDGEKYDIITIAAVANDKKILKLAVRLGGNPRNMTSMYDGTALIATAHLGHVEVVRYLLTTKVKVDHINNLGWTALLEAIILGDGGERHINIVQALLDAGASKVIADRHGVSPLQHAQSRGYKKMIELLQ